MTQRRYLRGMGSSSNCAAAHDPQEMPCPQIQTVTQHSCKEYSSRIPEQNEPNRTLTMGS